MESYYKKKKSHHNINTNSVPKPCAIEYIIGFYKVHLHYYYGKEFILNLIISI